MAFTYVGHDPFVHPPLQVEERRTLAVARYVTLVDVEEEGEASVPLAHQAAATLPHGDRI